MELDLSKKAKDKIDEIILFQIRRNIINLFKSFLIILNDLASNNILNQEDFAKYRKKILDDGNSKIREIEELFSNLEINIKQ